MPVILDNQDNNCWLKPTSPLSQVLSMLYAYPTEQMNAYPISTRIRVKTLNDKSLVKPAGKPLFEESGAVEMMNWGMRRKKNDSPDKPSWGERRNWVK